MDDLNKSRCTLISIHAPLTGSDGVTDYVAFCTRISIHAPLTGSDRIGSPQCWRVGDFNPRSPHRERPATTDISKYLHQISIHAPLTGSDLKDDQTTRKQKTISIHAPLTGSDRVSRRVNGWTVQFQSTLPSQGATREYLEYLREFAISIHAPLTGSDCAIHRQRFGRRAFQSTLPSQGATKRNVFL